MISLNSELQSLREQLQSAHSSAEREAETQEAVRQEVGQWEQAHKEALEQLTNTKASLTQVRSSAYTHTHSCHHYDPAQHVRDFALSLLTKLQSLGMLSTRPATSGTVCMHKRRLHVYKVIVCAVGLCPAVEG